MSLFVFRHAESTANRLGIIASDPATAISGFGLTETGLEQVAAARLPFAAERGSRIISSDFRRAHETALALAARLGCAPPQTTSLLRERGFGAFEGLANAHYETVWDHDARQSDCPGVESLASVAARIDELFDLLRPESAGRTIVLVSHGDVLQILLARAMGLPAWRHRDIPHLGNAECRLVPGWE